MVPWPEVAHWSSWRCVIVLRWFSKISLLNPGRVFRKFLKLKNAFLFFNRWLCAGFIFQIHLQPKKNCFKSVVCKNELCQDVIIPHLLSLTAARSLLIGACGEATMGRGYLDYKYWVYEDYLGVLVWMRRLFTNLTNSLKTFETFAPTVGSGVNPTQGFMSDDTHGPLVLLLTLLSWLPSNVL